jgi:ABC-type dipeptide/oligopeptide/nickel transport system permease component
MRRIVGRLLQLIPTTIGALILVFVLLRIVPGDPAAAILGSQATPEAVEALRAQMGLNKPLYAQFADYVSQLAHADLGRSLALHTSVTDLLVQALVPTLLLTLGSIIVTIILGIPLGMVAALKRGHSADYASSIVSLFGYSIPNFVWAVLFLALLTVDWKLFPSSGTGEGPLGTLDALVLPSIANGLFGVAVVARITRSSLLSVLPQDYVRTARAKGLTPLAVLSRHALKNALIPVITVVGLNFATLLQGAFVVELVFLRPGLGRTIIDAIQARDYPVLQGVLIISVIVVVVVNLMVDLLYTVADPRVRV